MSEFATIKQSYPILTCEISLFVRMRVFCGRQARKGFDLIDHNILLEELRGLEVSPSIISWIAGFLAGSNRAVRIEETLSDWKTLNGRIPQGT